MSKKPSVHAVRRGAGWVDLAWILEVGVRARRRNCRTVQANMGDSPRGLRPC